MRRWGVILDEPSSALEELHRFSNTDYPNVIQPLVIASWAGYFGDSELALEALRDVPVGGVSQALAYTIWRPIMADMRKQPAFRDLVRDMGLVDYWREFGWPDFFSRVGGGDFECR
jgi:hypothetical protein